MIDCERCEAVRAVGIAEACIRHAQADRARYAEGDAVRWTPPGDAARDVRVVDDYGRRVKVAYRSSGKRVAYADPAYLAPIEGRTT